MKLKALVVVGDGVEDYGDLLAVGRAEAKRLLRTHENVNVKDILYSARRGVHIAISRCRNGHTSNINTAARTHQLITMRGS